MRLTESELQIMELFWTTEKPLAGPDILTLSPADKLWKDNSLYIRYLRDLLTNPASQDYADYLISNFENDAEKDVILSKLLTKIGPVLGLIGTLIAMSPALVGLSTGDIAGMSYNMQVVFATTVVGLVISGVGLVSLQFKQRWYAKDVNNLDYVSRKLIEKNTEA